MVQFTEMTQIYQKNDKNKSLKPRVDVGDISKLIECKMFSRKLI